MKTQSIISRVILAVIGVGIIGAVGLNFYKGSTSTMQTRNTEPSTTLIEKGEYLARIGDCTSCHTSNQAQPFAGGIPFDLPIGTVFAPNISPDKEYGIGNYTLEDFDNAVRYGIRKDGKSLYPAMPFPDYAVISEEDISALYAYFMHGVKAQAVPRIEETIIWPLSMRWPLTAWRLIYAPKPNSFDASKYQSPEIARGAYLVQGLGHCSSCHTPRGIALNEEAYNDSDLKFLSGSNAPVDGWIPINLRSDNITGLGGISTEDLAMLLWSGRSEHNAVFGGMREVVQNSLQYATKEDITAIAKYLKSLAPINASNPQFVYDDSVHKALAVGDDSARGAALYLDNCAACHRTTGEGYPQFIPALAGNPAIQASNPANAIQIVAHGSTLHGTMNAPTTFVMPDLFNHRLTETDVADIVTFIRTSWGNQGEAVSTEDVKKSLKTKGL